MSRRWRSRLQVSVTMTVALALAAAVMLAACGGCGTTATTSPGTAAASPVASNQNAMPLPAPTVAGTLAFARVTSGFDEGYVVRTGDIYLMRTDGTGLTPFRTAFPTRYVDVGISESHAVALAAGIQRPRTMSVAGRFMPWPGGWWWSARRRRAGVVRSCHAR